MKRFRLSTLKLLIVIAALCVALVVQERRAARREAELLAWMKFSPQIVIRSDDLKDADAYFINGEIIQVGLQGGASRRRQVVETPRAKEEDEE